MRAAVLMALVLLVGTQAADARHYRFHYRHWGHIRYGDAKGAYALRDPGPNALAAPPRSGAEILVLGRPFPPSDWQLQPVNADQNGRRYVSPDGAATLCSMRAQRTGYSASNHLKAVAFVNGERVSTLAATQNELLVIGIKDHQTFMRKTDVASV